MHNALLIQAAMWSLLLQKLIWFNDERVLTFRTNLLTWAAIMFKCLTILY